MARNQYSEPRPSRHNVIFYDQKVVRLIIGSIAGQGEARADITRYICNDNCAEGGREMKNMNIGNLGLLSGAEKMRKLFSYCNCNSQV